MSKKPVVVAVSGAFDPVHVGHIRYIREAAKLGDTLIVILNRDDFLLRKKGFVFIPFWERREILQSIKGVDAVVASIDEDQTVSKTLELVKPDIFAKGGRGGVGLDEIPEIDTCNRLGCTVVLHVGGEIIQTESTLSQKEHEEPGKIKLTCPYCDDHPILREKCLYCHGTGKISVNKKIC
jgi:D-beta-D-heptose 7-phosphate kinase/D-beta-D-heptose 1-phosphate adenosyltransferase